MIPVLRKKDRARLLQANPGLMQWRLWGKFAATLALAIAGAVLFDWLSLPLPWMLGSMTFVTLGAVLRLRLFAPAGIRPP